MFRVGRSLLLFVWAVLCLSASATAQNSDHSDTCRIVHVYPHDPEAFTQGLVFVDGHLYESTGRNGKSSVRMVDLQTGRILQHYDLPAEYFGEGLTDWDSNLVQLTWTSGKGFVYDRFSLALKRTVRYKGEGWGLTHDFKHLIFSDGTPDLRFLDPESFSEIRHITVTDERGLAVDAINELEYIHGEGRERFWAG